MDCSLHAVIRAVILPEIRSDPLIEQLITYKQEKCSNFQENIRSIHSALAFASMGANLQPPPGKGPYGSL